MGNLLAMGAFALTMSISPGPVNMMTLSAGLHHGPVRALPFVVGSTAGFTALLVTVGLAANLVAALGGYWMQALSVIGAAVIIWFGIRIALAPTGLAETDMPDLPRAWQGALMQWVNPKAWAACLAAVSLFELAGPSRELAVFASLYFALCLIGVGSWAVLGSGIRRFLADPIRMQLFNIAVGGTLILLALGLAVDSLV
ncbi:LysE family translocator [Maricaulis maris]|uniref:Threonine/homoserine/homoserine lactone efflux protein n=1 Tax=Maricaulis maris TaxID=74318 RepID=A0A495DMM6_9PROT|nr:LysE family translocator [Maricaulis maris]RKR04145.1 threonine/homoserine/homoserine lactone efflux protein [Maricaulis maris]